MEIIDFAEKILFSDSIEDKLYSPDTFLSNKRNYHGAIPSAPVRPEKFNQNIKRSTFPRISELDCPRKRGQILHFFANHELLAMELMALCIIKLQDLPQSFLHGIAHTIKEEQEHMRLYMKRMQELGVEFGEIPLNNFFWDALKDISSISDYVSGMSMTFEQANLDFSLYYYDQLKKLGDFETADILKQVYEDEIGHVSFGLKWFEKLRPNKTDLFTEYRSSLKLPIDPHRGKSRLFFDSDGRKKAGFNKDFIDNMESYSSSVGRPPNVFWYNADSELELQSSRYQRKKHVELLLADYSSLQMFIATEGDILLCPKKPSTKFLREMKEAGVAMVDFVEYKDPFNKLPTIDKLHISFFAPWAHTPRSIEIGKSLTQNRHLEDEDSGYLDFYNKTNFPEIRCHLREQISTINDYDSVYDGMKCLTYEAVCNALKNQFEFGVSKAVIKESYGFSGSGMKKISTLSELDNNLINWIKKSINKYGAVYVEPWNQIDFEFSGVWNNYESTPNFQAIITDKSGQFKGHQLESFTHSIPKQLKKLFFEENGFLDQSKQVISEIKRKLVAASYKGPAGIDFYIFKDNRGEYVMKVFGEINPRTTMGHISNGLRRKIKPNTKAQWLLKSAKNLKNTQFDSWQDFYQSCKRDHPLKIENTKWKEGIIFTNDPFQKNHAQSILAIGQTAIDYIEKLLGDNSGT